MDESSDALGTQGAKEQVKELSSLVGFRAETKLDRMLLEGIFGAKMSKGVNSGNALA